MAETHSPIAAHQSLKIIDKVLLEFTVEAIKQMPKKIRVLMDFLIEKRERFASQSQSRRD